MFVPSKYQEAIFEFVTNGRGDGAVDAVAGSGKSTTLEKAALLLKTDRALFVAFNKHIADALGKRLEAAGSKMKAATLHSTGYGILMRAGYKPYQMNKYKYTDIIKDILTYKYANKQVKNLGDIAQEAAKLVDFARMTLTDPKSRDALRGMALTYGFYQDLDYFDTAWEVVAPAINIGASDQRKGFDYTDMIFLPVYNKYPAPKYDFIMVDECQDLNKAQLELALMLRGNGGRMLFVGDPRQSIYAFAGADCNSFSNIVERTGATVLPLSVCYRCPVTHIELARQLVPHIEAAPSAQAGKVTYSTTENVTALAREGDLILGRYTADLISLCYDLIKSGIAARVRGRAIGDGLKKLLKQVAKIEGFSFNELPVYLNSWKQMRLEQLRMKQADESALQTVLDQVECLTAVYENATPKATSYDELVARITELFDDERASVWLSTVHRAKGLEADRVMLLQARRSDVEIKPGMPATELMRGLMPWKWTRTADQERQEENVRYVALTRARVELVILAKAAAKPAAQVQPEALAA